MAATDAKSLRRKWPLQQAREGYHNSDWVANVNITQFAECADISDRSMIGIFDTPDFRVFIAKLTEEDASEDEVLRWLDCLEDQGVNTVIATSQNARLCDNYELLVRFDEDDEFDISVRQFIKNNDEISTYAFGLNWHGFNGKGCNDGDVKKQGNYVPSGYKRIGSKAYKSVNAANNAGKTARLGFFRSVVLMYQLYGFTVINQSLCN